MKKRDLIITGCNGQLGRAINKQLAGNEDYELVIIPMWLNWILPILIK